MITEKAFASSHQSFWTEVAPMLSHFVAKQDAYARNVWGPFSQVTHDDRGLIGELSFRLFAAGYGTGCAVDDLTSQEVARCVEQSVGFIRRFRAYPRNPVLNASAEGLEEASYLASRLQEYFKTEETSLRLWPAFRGCGWLASVQGDGLGETTLYEVKCGQSRVRGKDLKQVLCYLALNHASRMYSIEEVAVLNPRTGIVLRSTVESLCRNIAGTSAAELLGDIVAYVSAPRWALEGV